MTVTLFAGWLIWAAMTANQGQTPAKRILGHRVIGFASREPVGFARMFFVRGLLANLIAYIAIPLSFFIVLFMPFWDRNNENLWDKVSGTYVVSDPTDYWNLKPTLDIEAGGNF